MMSLVELVERIPMPPPLVKRGRGRPKFYPDRLFLKALVIMIVRHLHKVHKLLTVLEESTAEMKAMPVTLPAQIGCLRR